MLPNSPIVATNLADLGQPITEVLTISGNQVTLSFKPIIRSVDPTTGKSIPSTLRVTLGTSSDSFTEVYTTPVYGKHFFYTEIGGISNLVFDPTYAASVVTVSYLCRGEAIHASVLNEITGDLRYLETNISGSSYTGTNPPTLNSETPYSTLIGSQSITTSATFNLATLIPFSTPRILVFPANATNSNVVTQSVDTGAKTVTLSVTGTATVNYQIYVYKPV